MSTWSGRPTLVETNRSDADRAPPRGAVGLAYARTALPRLEPLTSQPYDGAVLLIVGALMSLGVVMVYSASVTISGPPFEWKNWWNTPLRQCIFAIGGFLAMLFGAHLDYRLLAWGRGRGVVPTAIYVLAAGLLIAVLIPGVGRVSLGAARSIVILSSPISLSFQPSELAKVALCIWLAAFLTRPGAAVGSFWRGFLPAMAGAGVLIGLTGVEDFGTAALMGGVTLGVLAVAGARWSHLGLIVLLGALGGAALVAMKEYRLQRLLAFVSGDRDAQAEGYQVTQSLIAIGSGGWWGRGLGDGVQKYGYLPQDNNDFIFAIVCEELGIVGGIAVIGLFGLLLWRGWRVAEASLTPFGKLLAVGVTLTLCAQAAFNLAVVTDSVPTKGISLPFVSAGGSGVLFLGLAAGLLAGVGRGTRWQAPGAAPPPG